MANTVVEYRLSWEMPDIWWAASYERCVDFSGLWPTIPWESPTVRIAKEENLDDIIRQYKQLKHWETSKSQPIRRVKLERRAYKPTDWKEYDPDKKI